MHHRPEVLERRAAALEYRHRLTVDDDRSARDCDAIAGEPHDPLQEHDSVVRREEHHDVAARRWAEVQRVVS